MMPAFTTLLSLKLPHSVSGIAILPELLGKGIRQQRSYLWGGQVTIHLGDWKGIRTGIEHNPNAPWQLYNLKADFKEVFNIAAKHPEIIETLTEIEEKEHQNAHIRG